MTRSAHRSDACSSISVVTTRPALLLATALAIFAPWPALAQSGAAAVAVAEVVREDVSASQSFVGTVMANRRVVVGSAVEGRVLEFPIRAGQPVAAGDTLAQLRTALIEIELAGAKAELDLRQAELAELRNGSRPEELRLAEATVQAAQAAKNLAETRFARAQRLLEGGSGISRDEFEEAQAGMLQAIASLDEATNNLELVRQGPRQERIQQAAARAAVQQQEIVSLQDRLDKFTVRSPFDGHVVSEMTQSGAWLLQGAAVAEIADLDPVEVEVYVPESFVAFTRRGLRCEVTADALPQRSFEGVVAQIVPMADSRARTFPVKVRVDNSVEADQPLLLPGMLAKVVLPTSDRREALLVPKDALRLGGPSPSVAKVVDGKVVLVTVTTGVSRDNRIAVTPQGEAMLQAGDLVVVRGNERLRPGQEVVISDRS